MGAKSVDDYVSSSYYQKALKKLAAQIAQNINPDVVYRNIPFGFSQLDIHSDGKTVILAVKSLSQTEAAFNVQEFQIPVSKLRKFLMSDTVQNVFRETPVISLGNNAITKQVSQGISQLMHNSKVKNHKRIEEIWTFPFYNHFISFEIKNVVHFPRVNGSSVFGWLSTVQWDGNQSHSSPEYAVEGLENYETRMHCLDYSIYKMLNKISGKRTITAWEYSLMNNNIAVIAA